MQKLTALLITAAALCGASAAHAQDKATLDLLVKKGLITQAEADQALAEKPAAVTPKQKDAKSVTLGGLVQARYTYVGLNQDPGSWSDASYFNVRRAMLFFNADLGQGWSLQINPEFDLGRSDYFPEAHYIDTALIKHSSEQGVLSMGLRKVNFAREEYVSAATELLPVERSGATREFTFVQFASYHMGVFWDGKIKDTGFFYGAALTNARQNFDIVRGANDHAVWANAGQTFKLENDMSLTVGLNLGRTTYLNAQYDEAFGYNPYAQLNAGKLTLCAEMIGMEQNGENGRADAHPTGYNLTAAYRATDTLEPVLRFSMLDTNGVPVSAGIPIPDLIPLPSPTSKYGYISNYLFDHSWSLYSGVNWYLRGHDLKVQAGYEFSQLTESAPTGATLDSHAVRLQMQAML